MCRLDGRAFFCVCVAALLGLSSGCDSGRSKLPQPGSPEYRDAVGAFQVGIAAFQVGDDVRADKNFGALTRIAPAEPAGWANWAALALRQGRLEAAEQRLERASELAPKQAE